MDRKVRPPHRLGRSPRLPQADPIPPPSGLIRCRRRYKPILQSLFGEDAAHISPVQLTLLASNVMDSMLFAGGQSVQSVLTQCLSLLLSDRGAKMLPKGFELTSSNVPVFVYETLRRTLCASLAMIPCHSRP